MSSQTTSFTSAPIHRERSALLAAKLNSMVRRRAGSPDCSHSDGDDFLPLYYWHSTGSKIADPFAAVHKSKTHCGNRKIANQLAATVVSGQMLR